MFAKSHKTILKLCIFCTILTSIASENVWLSPTHQQSIADQSPYFDHRFDESSLILPKELPVADRLCNEIMFENDDIKISEYNVPKCRMVDAHQHHVPNGTHSRSKREIFVRNVPMHFTIPSTSKSQKESFPAESYIRLDKMSICAEPGGELLIFDKGTSNLKVLFKFVNSGSTYQCNTLMIDSLPNPEAVSESNSLQVEYRLPHSDYTKSEARYRSIPPKDKAQGSSDRKGLRKITYSDTSGGDTIKVFDLEINYTEMPFQYPAITYLYNPGQESTDYKPNMVKTYVIPKKTDCSGPDCNKIGIEIDIQQLNLDFNKGDYLLIGPGNRPNFWQGAPSQIIARKIDSESDPDSSAKIWVHADSAFML